MSAYADTVTFSFNSLAQGANNGAVQTYMNSVLSATLGAGKTVVVAGAVAEKNYTGDNHVVGPNGGSKSLTLATSDGATVGGSPFLVNATKDTFLRNVGGTSPPNDRITMQFFGFEIVAISFDYEIFPNGSCPSLANCGTNQSNLPDFTFLADGVQIFHYFGVAPGTNGTYDESPLTAFNSNKELAPQLLGKGTWVFSTPVKSLAFIDWPATIGIDNLSITVVPEPGSILLLGTATVACLLLAKRRYAASRSRANDVS